MFRGLNRQMIIVIATCIMLYANLIVGSGSFSDEGAEQLVYYAFPTSFTPAPFTFAIWPPIFLGTIVFAIFQALPQNRSNTTLDRIAPLYLMGLVANTAQVWTPLGLSNLAVLVLFLSLCSAFWLLRRSPDHSKRMKAFAHVPVALFATWSGIALILNTCQLVVAQGGQVGQVSASFLIILSMSAGAIVIWKTQALSILAVMLWAAFGIFIATDGVSALSVTIVITSLISIAIAAASLRISKTRAHSF